MTSPPLREGVAEELVSALKVSFKDIIDFSFMMVITFHANANTTTTNTSDMISTQAGFSADGAGGSGLPAEGTCALSRALTQRISQKIVFSIHQGSGGWGPSLLATDLVSQPLPHRPLSASNVKIA